MKMAVTGMFKFLSSPSILLGETRDSEMRALLPRSVETFKEASCFESVVLGNPKEIIQNLLCIENVKLEIFL